MSEQVIILSYDVDTHRLSHHISVRCAVCGWKAGFAFQE